MVEPTKKSSPPTKGDSKDKQKAEEENKPKAESLPQERADPEEDEKAEASETVVEDQDQLSVFVKNVDFSTTQEELKEHFKECGEIKRVTLLKDKMTRQQNGNAYIEFSHPDEVTKAKIMNDTLFKGRQITVGAKKKTQPGKGRGASINPRGGNLFMQMMMMSMRGMRGGRGRGRDFKPFPRG